VQEFFSSTVTRLSDMFIYSHDTIMKHFTIFTQILCSTLSSTLRKYLHSVCWILCTITRQPPIFQMMNLRKPNLMFG